MDNLKIAEEILKKYNLAKEKSLNGKADFRVIVKTYFENMSKKDRDCFTNVYHFLGQISKVCEKLQPHQKKKTVSDYEFEEVRKDNNTFIQSEIQRGATPEFLEEMGYLVTVPRTI